MNEQRPEAMSDELLIDEWTNVCARLAQVSEATGRGQGYWCGTLYVEEVTH